MNWARVSISISRITRHVLKRSCDKKGLASLSCSSSKEGIRYFSLPHNMKKDSLYRSTQDWRIDITCSCFSYFWKDPYVITTCSPSKLRVSTSEFLVGFSTVDFHVHQKWGKIYWEFFLADCDSNSSSVQVSLSGHLKPVWRTIGDYITNQQYMWNWYFKLKFCPKYFHVEILMQSKKPE